MRSTLGPFCANRYQFFMCSVLRKLNIFVYPRPYKSHSRSQEIIDDMGREKFDSYFSFAFVRNPWEWQVSIYHYGCKTKTIPQYELFNSFAGFDEYIRWRCAEEVRFQKDFIYSPTGELLVDFVGRFENLEVDFQKICSRIGISASLPKLNVSNTKPYQGFYTSETEELVRKTFDSDIKLLEYEF